MAWYTIRYCRLLILKANYKATPFFKFVGNKYYSVRGKKVDNVIHKLKNNKFSFKLTLGNCIFYKVNHSVIVVKEH